MRHNLKSHPEFFREVISGAKTFEIRLNDRDYKVGDVLWLREYREPIGCQGGYTGWDCLKVVTYITSFEQKDNYVVMGIKEP